MPVDHDLTAVNEFPYHIRVTLTNANEAEDFALPSPPLLITVAPITNACRMAFAGTQGAQLTAAYKTVPGDTAYEVKQSVRQPAPTLYVDTANAGTVVEIGLERPV